MICIFIYLFKKGQSFFFLQAQTRLFHWEWRLKDDTAIRFVSTPVVPRRAFGLGKACIGD